MWRQFIFNAAALGFALALWNQIPAARASPIPGSIPQFNAGTGRGGFPNGGGGFPNGGGFNPRQNNGGGFNNRQNSAPGFNPTQNNGGGGFPNGGGGFQNGGGFSNKQYSGPGGTGFRTIGPNIRFIPADGKGPNRSIGNTSPVSGGNTIPPQFQPQKAVQSGPVQNSVLGNYQIHMKNDGTIVRTYGNEKVNLEIPGGKFPIPSNPRANQNI
jgi:hypothetical protein